MDWQRVYHIIDFIACSYATILHGYSYGSCIHIYTGLHDQRKLPACQNSWWHTSAIHLLTWKPSFLCKVVLMYVYKVQLYLSIPDSALVGYWVMAFLIKHNYKMDVIYLHCTFFFLGTGKMWILAIIGSKGKASWGSWMVAITCCYLYRESWHWFYSGLNLHFDLSIVCACCFCW